MLAVMGARLARGAGTFASDIHAGDGVAIAGLPGLIMNVDG
jgi:hypothetical protein